ARQPLAEQIASLSWPLTGPVWQAGVTCSQDRPCPSSAHSTGSRLSRRDDVHHGARRARRTAQVLRSPEAELLAEHDLPVSVARRTGTAVRGVGPTAVDDRAGGRATAVVADPAG